MRVAASERRVGVDLDGVRDPPMRGWRSSDRMCRLSATIVVGGSLYSAPRTTITLNADRVRDLVSIYRLSLSARLDHGITSPMRARSHVTKYSL